MCKETDAEMAMERPQSTQQLEVVGDPWESDLLNDAASDYAQSGSHPSELGIAGSCSVPNQ
jgi:hypothetical protein